MFSSANKVPNEINKWIVKIIVKKQPYWNTVKKGTYVQEHDKFSKCTKFEDCNLKNDPMNAKNAEITNYGIVRIFNEVTENKQ